MKFLRWIASWGLYQMGYGLHALANPLIDLSMKVQGAYGFKKWSSSEDDLWSTVDKSPNKSENK